MTPEDFIRKWRGVELSELAASHDHFNELCELLEIGKPTDADPRGEWFAFEKPVPKGGKAGGAGFADVWRSKCFVWEYANRQGRRWAFTTSNGGARYTSFYKQLDELERIDWQAVAARNWTAAPTREAKQSEFLMHSSFPWELVQRIGVHSQAMYGRVRTVLRDCAHRPKVEIKPDWYY